MTLGGQGSDPVTVNYATADVTATSGTDYEATTGTLTFAPGDTRKTITVALMDDDTDEARETFSVSLSGATGASLIGNGVGTGTILDDDDEPLMTIQGSESVEDGHLDFLASVWPASALPVTVNFMTEEFDPRAPPALELADGGSDYVHQRGSLTFAPGETQKLIRVALHDDAISERAEAVVVTLVKRSGATFETRGGTASCPWGGCDLDACCACGTILDNDSIGLSIQDASGAEDAGSLAFTVALERSADAPVTVNFSTSDGSAVAGDDVRQGFVRIINHSLKDGEILVEAIDDSGMRAGPVPLAIGANAATHFNSDDLEAGNAQKGLPDGVGPPSEGNWRLELSSPLDIEVLAYARTSDGFVTSLHDTVPASSGVHRAVFLNPGKNVDQVSRLRLVNPGEVDARVTLTGTDDAGGSSPEVVVTVPAGTGREWTAASLESGTDAQGGLGDGKWRLRLSSDRPVVALSLIESPTGNLTNLSTLPHTPGRAEGSHAVPLFPSASNGAGRQGFVRVINRSDVATEVHIEAFDNTEVEFEPLTLSVGADEVGSFNSDDLELGNAGKGLTGSTGAGTGDWRLELTSEHEISVLAYIRALDGFLTSMHDLVPQAEGKHRAVFFNPASNVNQVSVLRLVNPGGEDALLTITGIDDGGATPGTDVLVRVPAGTTGELTSAELESGEAEVIESGAIGDGTGKWRLRVSSDRPIRVMSLLENPTGHLTNLSTSADGAGSRSIATRDYR